MTAKSPEPDLRAIAESAGVSVSSVSRVLNSVEPVSDSVKLKVNNAVEELGRPKLTRSNRRAPRPIYVATPDDLNPYFYEIIHGAVAEAGAYKRIVAHVNVAQGSDSEEPFCRWMRRDSSAGGIILFPGVLSLGVFETFRRQFDRPIIAMHHCHGLTDVTTVKIDFVESMRRVTMHLLHLDHKRFAFVSGSGESPFGQSPTIRDKLLGVEQTLQEAGLRLPPAQILHGPPTIEFGFQASKRLMGMAAEVRPTAILCSNDMIAFGALHAARSSGMSVPSDISIVGFDDTNMAPHSNPPLTTVSIPKREMGKLAVQLLVRHENKDEASMYEYLMLESPLVVRESTGKAKM
jgi:DNA-binding LacI/PurR family transcriptional regulator